LQFVEMKTKMERCRRDFRRLAGISHFNAMDIGPSPQGVIDEFYEKKLIDARTWLETNGDAVIMMDHDFTDRVYEAGQTCEITLSISDFSHPSLAASALTWELIEGKKILASGALKFAHRPFCTSRIGKVRIEMPAVRKPKAVSLRAMIPGGRKRISNQWRFWVFPKEKSRSRGRAPSSFRLPMKKGRVLVTKRCGEEEIVFARSGGRVLLIAGEGLRRPFFPKFGYTEGKYFFLPPASYPPYEDGQQGTVVRRHKILGDFPHEGFCDLQFFRMIDKSPPIELDPFGALKEEPVIRQVGTYQVCQKLAYLIEFAFGKGGIIICALDLNPKLPEARYLLSQILTYAAGKNFRPKNRLSRKAVEFLISETQL
jgi:hypothetical protein